LTGDSHGKKVFAFYRNLSGDFGHVTIDVWMSKIYNVEFSGITDTEREALQADVTAIAELAGITPAAAQAALWVGYRELQGHSDSEGALSVIDALEVN
jgi:5-methylthioribose kinase